MRVALMQEHRLAVLRRQFELPRKRRTLRVRRRQVAKVVQSALAGRHRQLAA